VTDPALRQRVIDECLVPYLHDQGDAWALRADGEYQAPVPGAVSAQKALMLRFGGDVSHPG
jgi:polyphosphate kinase